MIYFLTYPESEGHWQGMYNEAVTSELARCGLEYRKIVVDYFSPSCHTVLNEVQYIRSKVDDVWLLAWAQNPLIELIEHKPGLKCGHVHGLCCFPFEPAVLAGVDLKEKTRFGYYDCLFLNSRWSYENAMRAYPEHAHRFVITGFPMDYGKLDPYRETPKEQDLVVFNQRFALERAPSLVIELARLLGQKGYRVRQLSGEPESRIAARSPDLGRLLRAGRAVGLDFVFNATKDEYHHRLAQASVVITTSLCDNLPVALLEAIYLGLVPAAPRSLCFPEFVHPDNLYAPFHLEQVVNLVVDRPVRPHAVTQFAKEKVMARYIAAFNRSGDGQSDHVWAPVTSGRDNSIGWGK